MTSCALLAWAGCEGDIDAASQVAARAGGDLGSIAVLQAADTEVRRIVIDLEGCDFLEIDNVGMGASDRDANLCSARSEVSDTCPDGPVIEDPPFGPNHCDWADLDRSVHFHADWQDVVSSTTDDAFQGSCLVDGHKATPKADIGHVGLAASTDGSELYIGWERFAVNGNERGSLILTRRPVELGVVGNCSDPQPLTDLVDGEAFRIDLKVDSTAALPFAQVQVFRYGIDPDDDDEVALNQTMEQVLASPRWQPVTEGIIAKALNVRPGTKNAPADEDTENGIDGNILSSAQWIEVAVDTMTVFGEGCGIDFIGQFATTASEGVNDALKDYSGPFHFTTAALEAELELFESCTPGEFAYALSLSLDGEPVDLDSGDLDVTFDVDCPGDEFDVMGLSPTTTSAIDIGDPTTPLLCTVTAHVTGASPLAGCDATTEAQVTVYPPLTAEATLDQACDGTFSYEATVTSSSGATSLFAWTFDVGGETVERSDASGSVTVPAELGSPVSVTGQLVVTDGTSRDTGGEEPESCTTTIAGLSVDVLRGIVLELTAAADADCSTESAEEALNVVQVNASFSGGSGSYVLSYTPTAGLVTTCAESVEDSDGSDTCTFALGDAFCTSGGVILKVEDAQDDSCGPKEATVQAVRECTLDVTPLADEGDQSLASG